MTTTRPIPDGYEALESVQDGATSDQAATTGELPAGRTWTQEQILFALSEMLENSGGYTPINGPSSVAAKPEMGIIQAPYKRKVETPGAWMK